MLDRLMRNTLSPQELELALELNRRTKTGRPEGVLGWYRKHEGRRPVRKASVPKGFVEVRVGKVQWHYHHQGPGRQPKPVAVVGYTLVPGLAKEARREQWKSGGLP